MRFGYKTRQNNNYTTSHAHVQTGENYNLYITCPNGTYYLLN
jgi:hypothetical protein